MGECDARGRNIKSAGILFSRYDLFIAINAQITFGSLLKREREAKGA